MTRPRLRVAVLAGEASGDQLGAGMIAALKEMADIDLMGVGGPLLAEQGLDSLFDYTDLSVMGLAEILPRIGSLMKRISQTVDAVEAFQPDVVLSIDAPDFAKRVVRRLRNRGVRAKYVHAVAPTVWAWRPGRAKYFAKLFDRLLCLFPFEPPYFEQVGLRADFVGHPAAQLVPERPQNRLQKPVHMLVLPGSRRQEVDRILPIFCEALQIIKDRYSDIELKLYTLTLPHIHQHVHAMFAAHGLEVDIRMGKQAKASLLADGDVALAVSGTMGLELALAGVPHINVYRMNPLTYIVVKILVQTPFTHLANILLNRFSVPELIQSRATAENCVQKILPLLRDEGVRQGQVDDFTQIRAMLDPGCASQLAARSILDEAVRLPTGV